jgi:phospholipid-binding lipoprotein MlaA
MIRFVKWAGMAAIFCALAACASSARDPRDPLENFNRAMFRFNDKADEKVLKPVATFYQKATPSLVQAGIGNFFGNIGDIWTSVNNLLQGKVGDGLSDMMRFTVNSVFGLGGVLDVASEAGIPRHKEDFGQTLGRWGVPPGPYLMLPVLGPATVRDASGLPVDFKGDLWTYKYPVRWRNTGTVVRLVDQRAALLGATDLLEAASLDRYEFVRDGFLQRRKNKVYDGGDISEKPLLPFWFFDNRPQNSSGSDDE